MAYSTPAMVRRALVSSPDGALPSPRSNTAADLSDGELQDSISEADSTIDSYIGGRYQTPVAPNDAGDIPHPVDYLSRSIAAYLATLTYRGSQDFTDTDPIVRRYKQAMDLLNAVATGKADLPLPENTGDSSSVSAGGAYNPYVGDLWTPEDFSLTVGRPSAWNGMW